MPSDAPLDPRQRRVEPGDRFEQVFPPSGDTLEVERWLDDERVAVRRRNGARQSFPASTLLNPTWWVRIDAAEVCACCGDVGLHWIAGDWYCEGCASCEVCGSPYCDEEEHRV